MVSSASADYMQGSWLAGEEESTHPQVVPQGNGTGAWPSPNASDYYPGGDWGASPTTTRLLANLTEAVLLGSTGGASTSEEPLVVVDLRIHHPALAVLLAFFCVATVFGNVLVMVAVYKEPYLHTVTNYFVCSLATADCLVGLVVMPFSAIHEVMDQYWVFGQDWCDVWHSVDVLASTGSILNLCVISLDRYWAITDPIAYPGRMTPSRAGGTFFIPQPKLWEQ